MKVTFKTGSEANYGNTNGELFFASNTKQIMLNGIKYIPKKLSELTNDSGFISSITKSMVEGVLTGNITSHTHSYLPLSGGTLTGNLTCNGTITAATFNGSLNGTAANASALSSHTISELTYVKINTGYPTSGVLVQTNIAANSDAMVNAHIWGNSYTALMPINTYIQFYNFSSGDKIIVYACNHYGLNLGNIYAFNYNGKVCFWFDVSKWMYQTIYVFVGTEYPYWAYNNVTSLSNVAKPTEGVTREVAITPKLNAFTDSNVASATKLVTPRTIKIGSASKSFDGSGDIEFTLNSIITQSDTINVGTINVAEQLTTKSITIGNHLSISSGVDIEGLTPSMIGAAEASHTHNYLPLSGGKMSNTNLVTNLNADLLDGLNSSDFVRNKNITSTSYESIDANNVWVNAVKHDYRWENVPNNGIASLLDLSYSSDWRTQLFFQPASTLKFYARQRYNGNTWGAWREIAFTDSNVASSSKWANARTITLTGSVTGSVSIDGSANVSLATTTNHTHSEYLPLSGGTLNGALTVPTLTSTGKILLGDSSLSAMVGSVGIQRHDETGFIGFLKDYNLSNSFNGVVLGWDGNYSLQGNSVRIDASTFTYKGNNVWHSGNLKLGYTSSGLSRAVQKDTNGNLFIVAPSLFEQGISDNYPKNLRWSNETEGQLVYDKEIEAGNFDTVEIGIPLADGTSKGFLKSTSTVTNVTGYTPCPVVSGTPYYKEDCLYLGSTEIGYTGIMEYGIQHTYNYGTNHSYLEDYTPDSIPRCVVLCFPDRSSNYRFLFWLSAFDEEDPYIARFYNSAYETWLTIDTASRQIILSYGNTWQS